MAGRGLTCFGRSSRSQQGFILVELLAALACAGLLVLLLAGAVQRSFTSLAQLEDGIRLQQGRRHLALQLEKTLGYEAVQLSVQGGGRISCKTLNGNKRLLLYCDKNVLYQKTTTGEGSGINPLSLEETKLTGWQVARVADDKLRVSFTLTSGRQSLAVTQLIICYNARVEDEA